MIPLVTLRPVSSTLIYGLGIAGFLYWLRQTKAVTIEEEPVIRKNDDETQEKKKLITTLIRIPQSSVGIVLGRHGKMIRSIESETNTFLKVFHYNPNQYAREHRRIEEIPEESWDHEVADLPRTPYEYAFVKVQAFKESQIALVRLRIRGLVADSQIERVSDVIEVPKKSVGWIIGKGGSNLKQINHMCRITEMDAGEYESIHIFGRVDCVEEAKNQIASSVAKWMRFNRRDEDFDKDLLELMDMKEELEQEEEFW